MKRIRLFSHTIVAALLVAAAALSLSGAASAAEGDSPFNKGEMDIGIVVRDAEKTAQFLTNAIGFQEIRGFSVTPELGKKIGLIDGHAVNVRMFKLPGQEHVTHLKVLSFAGVQTKEADQKFIHSTYGVRYLTILVKDMKAAVERLKQAKIKTEGETPLDLGGGTYITVVRDPDGNFFELIGPMAK